MRENSEKTKALFFLYRPDGRIMIDLTDRFDFGAEYRLLTTRRTPASTAVRSNSAAASSIRSGFPGVPFDRFDEDLAGDSYHGEGPYLKVRFKFDEKTLRKLNPLADKNSSSRRRRASIEKALSSYLEQMMNFRRRPFTEISRERSRPFPSWNKGLQPLFSPQAGT